MINVEAPYCDACGCRSFVAASTHQYYRHRATWKGRFVAIACGLLVAAFFHVLQA
jgi:hypothetical protein